MIKILPKIVANAKLFGVTRNDVPTIIACFTAVLLTKFVANDGVNLCYNDSVAKFVVAILKLYWLSYVNKGLKNCTTMVASYDWLRENWLS